MSGLFIYPTNSPFTRDRYVTPAGKRLQEAAYGNSFNSFFTNYFQDTRLQLGLGQDIIRQTYLPNGR